MRRIGVLNRGEPALRFLRALKEFNIEHEIAIEGIALYTDPDRTSPFVRFSESAIALGAPVRENGVSAYCDHDFILDILEKNNIDAVWPGWGFLSEDASFVEKLEELRVFHQNLGRNPHYVNYDIANKCCIKAKREKDG